LLSLGFAPFKRFSVTYYIKIAADDVRKAMRTLENGVTEAGQMQSDTARTLEGKSPADPS
jgi:hypothetical protein